MPSGMDLGAESETAYRGRSEQLGFSRKPYALRLFPVNGTEGIATDEWI
ncbi:hypothetical protein [Cohnella endophytica]|nr:hypothetical protein [Cohnella endophytica]